MKALLLVLFSAVAAWAENPAVNPHTTAADRAAGAKIFRAHCSPCHGVKGTGGLGPNLTTGRFFHGDSDADLYRNISNGVEGTAMLGIFFDGTQVWQLVAFVRSLSQTPEPPPISGEAAHGERLFREKGCSGCHTARGAGGSRGPDLSVIGSARSPENLRQSIVDPNAVVDRAYWVAKIVARDGSSYSGFVMNEDTYAIQILDFSRGLVTVSRDDFRDFGIDRGSLMPSYEGKLSSAEINDLVAYLASLTLKREKPE